MSDSCGPEVWNEFYLLIQDKNFCSGLLKTKKSRSLFIEWLIETGPSALTTLLQIHQTLDKLYKQSETKIRERNDHILKSQALSFGAFITTLGYEPADSCKRTDEVSGEIIYQYLDKYYKVSKVDVIELIQISNNSKNTTIRVLFKDKTTRIFPWDQLGEILSILT